MALQQISQTMICILCTYTTQSGIYGWSTFKRLKNPDGLSVAVLRFCKLAVFFVFPGDRFINVAQIFG